MGVGVGAPEKVTPELKTCSAGYQSATESLSLGRMGVGIGAPEKVTHRTENRHVQKQ